MLAVLRKYGSSGRRTTATIGAAMQVVIIGGLLYAGFFVKAEVQVPDIRPPAIEKRDMFFGLASPMPHVIWAVGTGGKIIRSDDQGVSWSVQSLPTPVHLQSIAAWDVNRAVVVGNNGAISVTSDGGNSWASTQPPLSKVSNKLLKVKAFDGGHAWAVGEMGALLFSGNYGASWERRVDEKDVAWNDIAFHGERGWVVGEFGHAMITEDGGATWKSVATPAKSSLMAVAFRDEARGVAVGIAGTIVTTQDSGRSWQSVPANTREHLLSVIWDADTWVAVGDKGVLILGDKAGQVTRTTRVAENYLGWNAQIMRGAHGYLLAGSVLARLKNGQLKIFGRHA